MSLQYAVRQHLIIGEWIFFVPGENDVSFVLDNSIDYTKENIRNGQLIYPYFMATSVIKSPRDIKVECIQLHKLFPSFSPGLGSLSRKSDLGLHGIVLEEGEIEILGQTTDFTLAVNSHFNFDDLALF